MIMKQKQIWLLFPFVALLLTLSLAIAGCGGTPAPKPQPTFALKVRPETTEVQVGQSVAIVAEVEPLEKLDLKWSVSGTAEGTLNTDTGEQVVYTAGKEGTDIVVAEGTTASGVFVKQTVSLTVVGEPVTCPSADAEGTVAPAVAISSITFIVNGVEQVVDDFGSLQASFGEQVEVEEITICVDPFEGKGGQVYVEFDPVDTDGETIKPEVKGTRSVPVTPGFTTIPGPDYTWAMGDNWRHISVVTVHYPPGGGTQNLECEGGACEVDDGMIPITFVPPTATPAPSPTEAPSPPSPPDAVIVAHVHLRSGPGTEYDIISTLGPGQVLTVTGRIADATWLQVNIDQMQEGWVINRTDLVTLNLSSEQVEQIPVVLPPPPLPPPPTPTCPITEPAGGDENLGHANEVRVTCSDVPDSLYVWVLVYSHHDHNYYPQPGPIGMGSGQYEGMAYLGTPTEGIGDQYDIIVALADEVANAVLQSAATNYIGWPDLPGGVEEKDRITVRRGPSPPTCQITGPADGDDNLGHANEVRVTCSDVPDSLYVWVLVYSHHDHNYYPQPGPIGMGSGQYEGMAYLGTPTEGIGHEYDIIVALADEAANTVLQSAAANHNGWPSLPSGVEEKNRITVRRGH